MNVQEPFECTGQLISVEVIGKDPSNDRCAMNESGAGGEGPASAGSPGDTAPPSLSKNNNCNEAIKKLFSSGHQRVSLVLEVEAEAMVKDYGIDHILFGTLTFAEDITDEGEAQERLRSYRLALMQDFQRAIVTMERQKSGRIHYHLIAATWFGFDPKAFPFDEVERKYYRNVDPKIRELWKRQRDAAQARGFGRVEFMPVKKTGKALARYVSKYVVKHLNGCISGGWASKTRLVRFWGYVKKEGRQVVANHRRASCQLSWATDGGRRFRNEAKKIAEVLGYKSLGSFGDVCREVLGVSWGWVMMNLVNRGHRVNAEEWESLEKAREGIGPKAWALLGPFDAAKDSYEEMKRKTSAWAYHKARGTLMDIQDSHDASVFAWRDMIGKMNKSAELFEWGEAFLRRVAWARKKPLA